MSRNAHWVLALMALLLPAGANAQPAAAPSCSGDGALALPPGFCASVFADDIGRARHIAVSADGVLYANTRSGRGGASSGEGFLLALQDTDGDGKADEVHRFGSTSSGGTGIAVWRDFLYAETGDRIVRYALKPGAVVPAGEPETVVSGLPLTGDHRAHPFAIDPAGALYVDLGSATNACQVRNRMPGSPGHEPCTELETRGGIWRYEAARTGQAFSPKERFATGLRNAEGIDFDAAGRIFATQHGRDQLAQNWPNLYTTEAGAELPAEELVEVEEGADYGWPECYFDPKQNKLVLAPEYGGDGGKAVGICAQKRPPVAAFPAHWAPNDLLIYAGRQFPAAYRGGAFIAFHGSWNRSPLPQGGYNVVFQPLADGKASGPWIVFADGFAGETKQPGEAEHRPSGLAMGPDGALYVSDDAHGRIWRIVFRGNPATTGPEPASGAASGAFAPPVSAADTTPPEGIHPNAGAGSLPTPPGSSPQQVALGERIYHGTAGGTCASCQGAAGRGTPQGVDLTRGRWLWSDGSLAGLARTIAEGVADPKQSTGAMPPMGGADLSKDQVAAVAAYVWALGHRQR
jgi:glucose/arabinose dehydrogenase